LTDAAAAAIAAGQVVGLPTETVYGLAADAANRAAVAEIYRIKGRPADHPLIVHVLGEEQARLWGVWNPAAQRLAAAFWPGPLTIVLRRLATAAPWACAGHSTIALRSPAHPVAREVMTKLLGAGVTGIAAPSANRFGRVSPTSAAHVRADLGTDVAIVLEGGVADIGIESTIVDLSRDGAFLLRPGHITADDLAAVLQAPVAAPDREAPKVSGSLASHYAPSAPLQLVPSANLQSALARALAAGRRVALWSLESPLQQEARVMWRMQPRAVEAVERDLYRMMRELDELGADLILVEAPPQTDAWLAVNDRLQRAAAPRPVAEDGASAV
jgi:L-threonylcarbamoyladenylate synthase